MRGPRMRGPRTRVPRTRGPRTSRLPRTRTIPGQRHTHHHRAHTRPEASKSPHQPQTYHLCTLRLINVYLYNEFPYESRRERSKGKSKITHDSRFSNSISSILQNSLTSKTLSLSGSTEYGCKWSCIIMFIISTSIKIYSLTR